LRNDEYQQVTGLVDGVLFFSHKKNALPHAPRDKEYTCVR
jgi:hypothetical protein